MDLIEHAHLYRQRAANLRLAATTATFQETRTAFLALALDYDDLAARLEKLERERNGALTAAKPLRLRRQS